MYFLNGRNVRNQWTVFNMPKMILGAVGLFLVLIYVVYIMFRPLVQHGTSNYVSVNDKWSNSGNILSQYHLITTYFFGDVSFCCSFNQLVCLTILIFTVVLHSIICFSDNLIAWVRLFCIRGYSF